MSKKQVQRVDEKMMSVDELNAMLDEMTANGIPMEDEVELGDDGQELFEEKDEDYYND